MPLSSPSMPAAGDGCLQSLRTAHYSSRAVTTCAEKGSYGSPLRKCAEFHAADDCTPKWSCKRWLDMRLTVRILSFILKLQREKGSFQKPQIHQQLPVYRRLQKISLPKISRHCCRERQGTASVTVQHILIQQLHIQRWCFIVFPIKLCWPQTQKNYR